VREISTFWLISGRLTD
jgi:hypothetical protein